MDNNVPEQMWQPDLELFFIKDELKKLKADLKDEVDIEAFVKSADLPKEKKQRILRTLTKVKQKRIDNERIKDKIVKDTHDDKPNKGKGKVLQ